MPILTGLSLIAGELASGNAGKQFSAVNPATGEKLSPSYHTSTPEQVDVASLAAQDAFASYRNVPGTERATFLRVIAANIDSIVDDLVDRVQQETALAEPRIRGEAARTSNQFRLFAAMLEEGFWVDARIETALPKRQPVPRPDLRSMLRPLGPVAVFGASNFPLAYSVGGGDTASALAAGCPVVVKAHPAHPGTSELLGQAICSAVRSCKLHPGLFSVLFDAGIEVGTALVQHHAIKAVGFTGSISGGRALFDLAAKRHEPIPVYAEMGSVNPIFLLPRALEANWNQIAEGLHQSVTQGLGQFCTKPGIVFTSGHNHFRSRLQELIQTTAPGAMLHTGIAKSYSQGVEQLATHAGVNGLSRPPGIRAGAIARAGLFETDISTFLGADELAAEVFGPTTLLVRYETTEDLLEVARRLEGQLTATVHGDPDDLMNARELISMLETRAGRLIFNQFPTGVEVGDAIVHGGPYPASSDSRTTSVGSRAIFRFVRPVCYQNFPDAALPQELQAINPLRIRRIVNGALELPSS